MKQKISGLILTITLLLCLAVPAAAATQTGYGFRQKSISLQVGETKELYVYNNGKKIDPAKIRWKSSKPETVSVSKGKIRVKKAGSARIDAVYGRKKTTCIINAYNKNVKKNLSGSILHRGLSLEAPENSIPAFKLAGQKGAQYIETDVRQLRDGTLVIFHDATLKRMCGVNKKIESLTYKELKKYPIITGTNASAYKNNMIPTLQQYLQCCNQYSVTPVIEIKSQLNSTGIAKFNKIIKMSKKSPVVISFNEEPLKLLRRINRNVSIQWILRDRITDAALNECYRYKFDVSAQYRYADKTTIRKAHSRNIKVALCLFTDSKTANRYRSLGADYLTCESIL